MATAKKATAKKTAAKKRTARKTAGKSYPAKSPRRRRGAPGSIAPIYSPAGSMTPAQQAAFPGTDLVFAVQLPVDNTTGPVISALVGPNLRPVLVDLTRGASSGPIQLLPKAGEFLQIMYPDNTVSGCVNRPRWMWFGVPVTQL